MNRSAQIIRVFVQTIAVLLLSTPLILLLMVLQSEPAVPASPALDNVEIAQVENLLVSNAPGDVNSATLQQLSLSEDELNLLLRYAVELLNLQTSVAANIALPGEKLTAVISIPISTKFIPVHLNLSADFSADGELLQLDSLQMGTLGIPGNLVASLLRGLQNRYLVDSSGWDDIQQLLASVRTLKLTERQLSLSLQWQPELIANIRSQAQLLLISAADQERIIRHYLQLNEVINAIPEATRAVSLTTLLAPLFAAAGSRSLTEEQDPIADNRTLLLTLAAYVNEEPISQLIGPELATTLPQPRQIEVRVQRRQDLAQHIASTAAITAAAGAGFAEKLSNTKEAYDARYRSGFSFSDLTANTAGVALGRTSTQSPASARLMQVRLAALTEDAQYLPLVSNLNDGLSENDFNNLYRDRNEEYQKRVAEIETLVLNLPLFQDP